jgi:fumarylacetoacetase
MTSWVPVPESSPFPVQNLPYGVFSCDGDLPRVGVAIGDHVLDLAALDRAGLTHLTGLTGPAGQALDAPSLNPLMACGPAVWRAIRRELTRLLTDPVSRDAVEPHLIARETAAMHLPFEVADYVDFYSSLQHATNVGKMFRPDAEALNPNWRRLPVGYHGRAGTVVVSGTPVVRPCGQRRRSGDPDPFYGPSARLDIEAEVGFVVGAGSEPGATVAPDALPEHVFGAVLVNDWSARDIQRWEYVPLGPFLAKSFATSISPWVVPLEALEQARVIPPVQDPPPLDYLRGHEPWGLDLDLEVEWNGDVVSRPPFREMYWTPAQQLAHLTANGARLRTGDLFASGTVSGSERGQWGSFLELTWGGAEPLTLSDGTSRSFLEDGDTVTIRASAPGADGVRIGFGEVTGTIEPARLDGKAS